MNRVRVYILPGFFLTLAIGIVLIPFRWLAAWMIAAMVHEVFHLIAIILCEVPVRYIKIGALGAAISIDMNSGRKMAICSLAGPAGGLMLLLFIRYIPRIALCGLAQSVYNLLPIYPLDGGQAFLGFLTPYFSPKVTKMIQTAVELLIKGVLILSALYAVFVLKLGFLPALIAAAVIIKNKKIPCKQRPLRVQ